MCDLTESGGICPYKYDCKVENPGEMPGCVLDDIDWNTACGIYLDYTIQKAKMLAFSLNEKDWQKFLNYVEYINPE